MGTLRAAASPGAAELPPAPARSGCGLGIWGLHVAVTAGSPAGGTESRGAGRRGRPGTRERLRTAAWGALATVAVRVRLQFFPSRPRGAKCWTCPAEVTGRGAQPGCGGGFWIPGVGVERGEVEEGAPVSGFFTPSLGTEWSISTGGLY